MESGRGKGGGQEVRRVIRGKSTQQRRFLSAEVRQGQGTLMAVLSLMRVKAPELHARQKHKLAAYSPKEPRCRFWLTQN